MRMAWTTYTPCVVLLVQVFSHVSEGTLARGNKSLPRLLLHLVIHSVNTILYLYFSLSSTLKSMCPCLEHEAFSECSEYYSGSFAWRVTGKWTRIINDKSKNRMLAECGIWLLQSTPICACLIFINITDINKLNYLNQIDHVIQLIMSI